ncbi:RNA polymerase sigma-28 (SigD/FliA/WhiG) subunit [Orenia metallireducens]|uniref:RNA polymerase, sigma 28 subunit, SigD/FliA/WhiG n=1 Tax=Orenia metallireducens TaxID=1413210 RepID=A0A285FNA6_9FIRM|nr:FliA/WhiG family RNA polymerase sigma factor [Orenia metallireducens]PRX33649.1 RNA polymerase sigma-28 (SigD/FliA/WhiG) subunit [Orenia metallireducens]SNY12770.1 RNA polymerase, sigma 28 subunit, SigD/FliA/WhiG [Orenia metallireducens]
MKRSDNLKEDILWKKYKKNNCQQSKEDLILSYTPLVKHVAGKIITKIPDGFTFDDLLNYGFLGLIDAMNRYDIDRGIKFSTYAVPRIRGAIYDEIRKLDWVPQSIRRKSKKLSNTYNKLQKKLRRNPDDEEVRAELGLSCEEFNNLLVDVNIPENISLESFFNVKGGDKIELKDLISDSADKEPDNLFFYDQMKELLGESIDKLPEKERLVVSLYYYEDLTLTEIGEIMDLTTARISQLHTKAIFRLRGYLSRKKDLLFA